MPRALVSAATFVLSALLASCASAGRAPPGAPGHAAARHEGEAAFVAADEAFSAASAARDAAAFGRLVAADAVFFTARGLREGRDAVVAGWAPMLTPGGPLLTWSPERAEASAEGDVGFTIGRWTLEDRGETASGRYLSVWRRGDGGRVEAVLDGTFLDAAGAPAAEVSVVREVRSRAGDLVARLGRIERGPGSPGLSLAITRLEAGRETVVAETRLPLAPPAP